MSKLGITDCKVFIAFCADSTTFNLTASVVFDFKLSRDDLFVADTPVSVVGAAPTCCLVAAYALFISFPVAV